MLETLDQTQLNFSPESLQLLNICLGFIMYGVALELKISHFSALKKHPKSVIGGVIAQFIFLPALTFLLVLLLKPIPSIALGMMLVAACPGGNISNFMSLTAKGNAALSVSLTLIATVLSVFMTPFNLTFWGRMYPETAGLLKEVSLNFLDMAQVVVILLVIPLILGMLTAAKLPTFTAKILKPVKVLSLLIFGGFVVVAFSSNVDAFLTYIQYVVFLVLVHNSVALLMGYSWAKMLRLPETDARTLSIETGIQNSGLGMILIFSFFDGLGGMMIVAAWWGIWHIISGLSMVYFWKKRPIQD